MSIASIKPHMLLPERELIINKRFLLQGNPALFASVTEQGGIIKLWLFQQIPDDLTTVAEDFVPERGYTNREELIRRISRTNIACLHFSEITIQGIEFSISQSAYGVIGNDPMSLMKVQHFAEAGVDLTTIENIGFGTLVLCEFQLTNGSAFPEIDTSKEMPISLRMLDEHTEVLVDPPHSFHLCTGEQDISRSFYDPVQGRDIIYYINSVVCHDLLKQAEEQYNDEATLKTWREHGLDDAAIERMKAQLPESLGHICPKGHELLLIQYETPDNIQLNFYTTEYLDSVPVWSNSGSSVGMIGTPGESRHGFPVRTGLLKTVPAGFTGTVDAELVSWVRVIPGELIEN